jgi:hypothetical protein
MMSIGTTAGIKALTTTMAGIEIVKEDALVIEVVIEIVTVSIVSIVTVTVIVILADVRGAVNVRRNHDVRIAAVTEIVVVIKTANLLVEAAEKRKVMPKMSQLQLHQESMLMWEFLVENTLILAEVITSNI